MAQVTEAISRRVEVLLARSSEAWRRLPRVEVEIAGWDLLDRIDFVEEWPIEEQRLNELERYAEAGVLTPEQSDRYEELKRLVERNRPIIHRLRRS